MFPNKNEFVRKKFWFATNVAHRDQFPPVKKDAGHGPLRFNPCPQGLQPDRESLPLTLYDESSSSVASRRTAAPKRERTATHLCLWNCALRFPMVDQFGPCRRTRPLKLTLGTKLACRRSFIGRRNECRAWTEKQHSACGEFQSMPPKDSLLDESFFAAKVVFYCWPYAPSLIHVVSASAARRWRVERGEYSGTGPAIPPPLTR